MKNNTIKDTTKVVGETVSTSKKKIAIQKALLKGMTYCQIREALRNDELGLGEPLTHSSIQKLITAVYKEMRECFKEEKEAIVEQQYERLMNLYSTSLEANDRTNALNSLKEINKMTGVYEPQKVDLSVSGEIEIDFSMD